MNMKIVMDKETLRTGNLIILKKLSVLVQILSSL